MSSTRTFASLENKVAPVVPGCPLPVVLIHVRDAAIEVCENTLAWRYEQNEIRLTPNIYTYEYEVPDDTEVCGIIHAARNGVAMSALTMDDVHRLYPAWPDLTAVSTPTFISQFHPDEFVVVPIPDNSETYDVKMFLALRPTPAATGMDETMFDELEQLILHSTLFRLLSQPEKSWTDKDLATWHYRQSIFKTSQRRAKANLGVARGSLSVRMTPFA